MTVNCLQARRAIAERNCDEDSGISTHLRECEGCARYAARIAAEDGVIRQAIRNEVPADLGANILMAQAFELRRRRRHRRFAVAAVAASVAIVALLVGVPRYQEHRLTSEVLVLIEAADYALENRDPLTQETVEGALAPVGFVLRAPLERVSFAGRCLVQGTLSGHLVLRDQQRPVTVLLIPERSITQPLRFSDANWSGIVVPNANGVMAVLAPRGTDMQGVAARIEAAVRWPIRT